MSRIGNKTIALPKGVEVNVKDGIVLVKGPKGQISKPLVPLVGVEVTDGVVKVTRENNSKSAKSFHGLMRALLANMVEGGRSPVLPKSRLEQLGYAIAIYPGTGFFAAAAALKGVYRHLENTGSSLGTNKTLYPIEEMHELMGFKEVWDFEKKWSK